MKTCKQAITINSMKRGIEREKSHVWLQAEGSGRNCSLAEQPTFYVEFILWSFCALL